MSPKAKAIAILALVVLFGVGPHLPDLMLSSGYAIVPPIVKLVSAVIAAAGSIVLANLPALKTLAGADNRNSSGGPGLKLDSTPSKPPPATGGPSPYRTTPQIVPPFARPIRLVHAGSFAMSLLRAMATVVVAVACGPNATGTVVNNLSPPAQCVVAALLSGKVDLTNPGTAALQIMGLCAGTTVESVIAMIEQLVGADAGLGASPLPASTVSQLQAVLAELHKLPAGFSHADAVAALAAKK